jgi:glycosyltransferase involved in cell wall biosynthesis
MDRLLLVLPVPFRRDGDVLLFEQQACNGLERWAENFEHIDLACPVKPNASAPDEDSTTLWQDVRELSCFNRVQFMALPWAFRLPDFIQNYPHICQMLRQKIQLSRYLSFAIGGLVGDWGAVACLEAMRLKRPYSVWTDRVEHEVILRTNQTRVLKSRIKNRLVTVPLMKRYHHYVISHSALGLFHGRDCYEAYAPYCTNPHIVHDVHLKASDKIPDDRLAQKIARVMAGEPLKIVYAGRVLEMKGPLDWVAVMHQLQQQGLQYQASWFGDGPLLPQVQSFIAENNLSERVETPGFLGDRQQLLEHIRDADLFVFCHKTPESPRCLIEALMSGCALVGYDTPYPRDLVEGSTAAVLTPQHDITALAKAILALDQNRPLLASVLQKSAEIGSHYSDEAVFRQRSELIKSHL